MKKVLLIGDDVHADRYVSSLLFIDDIDLYVLNNNEKTQDIVQHYGVKSINMYNAKNDINDFDYIFYVVPNSFDSDIYNLLMDYKNTLLLEKLQMNLLLIKKLDCMVYFIHLRYFDEKKEYKVDKINNIEWPNLIDDKMDIFVNTIPNILDFVVLSFGKNVFDLRFSSIKYIDNSVKFEICCEDIIFNVNVFGTNDLEKKPKLNDFVIEWPNYYLCITNFVNMLLNNNLDYDHSIENEKKYVEIVRKMRSDIL